MGDNIAIDALLLMLNTHYKLEMTKRHLFRYIESGAIYPPLDGRAINSNRRVLHFLPDAHCEVFAAHQLIHHPLFRVRMEHVGFARYWANQMANPNLLWEEKDFDQLVANYMLELQLAAEWIAQKERARLIETHKVSVEQIEGIRVSAQLLFSLETRKVSIKYMKQERSPDTAGSLSLEDRLDLSDEATPLEKMKAYAIDGMHRGIMKA